MQSITILAIYMYLSSVGTLDHFAILFVKMKWKVAKSWSSMYRVSDELRPLSLGSCTKYAQFYMRPFRRLIYNDLLKPLKMHDLSP